MKKLTVLALAILFISCDKDSAEDFENNSSSSDSGYRIIGRYYDLNINGGTESQELYEYENYDNDYDPDSYSNLISETGIDILDYRDYFANEYGITLRENNFNVDNSFYYKDFKTNQILKINMPHLLTNEWSYWHYERSFYFLYRDDSTYDSNDDSLEYKLKIINFETNQESELNVGRFLSAEYGKFQVELIGNIVYFLRLPDFFINEGEVSLVSINLDSLEIIENSSYFKSDRYNLITDSSKDCYLFGQDFNYKYNLNSNSFEELSIPGESNYLDPGFTNQRYDQIVVNNKVISYFAPPAPSAELALPVVLDLETGQVTIIQFSEEPTQFEDDEIGPWRPFIKCFSVDAKTETIIVGVENQLGAEFQSQGVFTVDFAGNILNKQKIPILPIQIIK
ncbi:hypothetical protein SAMN04488007_3592 [Maribacter aquivivus]|uniref:Uncharacterized protein n=1 Tax=Maribacter aquivivus TaxID=228958 RepID=A0A1M6UD01_9FLAO|nr:hypothetical protein [Maribacter aquivivus]SHK67041.1 hypothetical protein SAMN04488007_3592 [Maribacter aquivivus]